MARVLGASYADIRILMQKTEVITVKNGTVEGVSKDDDEGFGVRVLANGAWGFASSYRLEPGEIDRVTALAVRVARASALAKRAEVRLGPAVVSRGSYSTTVRIDPFAISMEDKIALLLRADAAMRSVKGVSLAESSLEFLAIEKLFASSEGSLVEQHLVESGGGIEATAVADGEVQKRSHPNSFGRQQGTAGFEFILDMKLEE